MKMKLGLTGILLCISFWGFAQTNDDLRLDYTPLVCLNDTSAALRVVTVRNLCQGDSRFEGGTFRIKWGDGEESVFGEQSELTHLYAAYKTYEMTFSWTSADHTKTLQKVFPVTLKRAPVAGFNIPSAGSCVNMQTVLQLTDYEQEYPETKYYFRYKGRLMGEYTQADVLASGGVVQQVFREKMCDEFIQLTLTNECVEKGFITESSTATLKPLTVMSPAKIDFSVIPSPVCTENPFDLVIDESRLSVCGARVDYLWKLEGQGSYSGSEPAVRPYDRPGEYEVTLIARVGQYGCANDTVTKVIRVIQHVTADFTVDEDTLCFSGTPLNVFFRNLSTGDSIQNCTWSVNGVVKKISRNQQDFTYTVTQPGIYQVQLLMENACSASIKDTTIVVRQSPEITNFALQVYDSLCPQSEAGLRMDMSDFVVYDWHGNPAKAQWTITPADGVSCDPGYGPATLYPRITLAAGKTYDIQVKVDGIKVNGVNCGDPATWSVTRKLKVNDPRINAGVEPSVPIVGDTVIYICDGEEIAFLNHSTGENLKYLWSIEPDYTRELDRNWSVTYVSGSASSPSPKMRFNGYGDFLVRNTLMVYCNQKTVQFKVRVRKDPTINHLILPAEVCPRDVLDMSDYFSCDFFNSERKIMWTFTPNTVDFLNGTSAQSVYPFVHFRESGAYHVKVELLGGLCSDPTAKVSEEADLRVRLSALTSGITVGKTEVCEGKTIVFDNRASDPENFLRYKWSVSPSGGSVFIGDDSTSSRVQVSFGKWGTYYMIGEVRSYCDTLIADPVEIIIHKNPGVSLKDSAFCPGVVTIAEPWVHYEWYNNLPEVQEWTIRRVDGMEVPGDYEVDGTAGLTSLYPRIDFRRPGKYRVRVKLKHAGCPETDPVVEKEFWVYDPVVYGDIVLQDPLPDAPLQTEICESGIVKFTNTMAEEADALKWMWSIEEGIPGGCEFFNGTSPNDPEPQMRFTASGNYRVKVVIYSTCNPPIEKEFQIIVRGIPEIEFADRMKRVCAGDGQPLDMSRYIRYKTLNNAVITPEWSIEPATGYSWVDGYGSTTEYPRILFQDNAHYTIRLTAYTKCAAGGKLELENEIDVISSDLKSVFTVGKDSVGCVNDPRPFEVLLQNNSLGDSLEYTWTISSSGGHQFVSGDEHTESPRIHLTDQGFYEINLHVSNGCNTDDSLFRIKTFAVPEIQIQDIANECEVFHFAGKDRIHIDDHNDEVREANWTITPVPGYASEGYVFKNGTTPNSVYPDIDFNTCDYQVQVVFKNRCQTAGTAEFQVRVDKFIPIEPQLLDEEICELSEPHLLTAAPAGGTWTLKAPSLPESEKILYREGENYYFNPAFEPYAQKDIELVYTYRHLSCTDRDTINMRVWPLPFVEAGDNPEMCLNDAPLLLVGRDSAVYGHWISNRGHWEHENTVLTGHFFPARGPGDFDLKYFYTDDHNCRNIDSTVLTVHPLPETRFTVAAMNCIFSDVLFTPDQAEGNTFEWNFGDGSPNEKSDNQQIHKYEDFGFREVICMAETVYGCKDTSEVKRIEILNLPPVPFFDVDTLQGCAPFEVQISIDSAAYRSNHNYLSFHWYYGDGTVTDTLMPIVPKFYPSASWDTTYVTRFTVSNMCDTLHYDTTITVYSVPKVSFALMHDWECTPVALELQNTTTGNNCLFDWTFTNGRTGEVVKRTDVRNPVHEFTTDSASTTYYISLRAENRCDEDEFTDSLLVKPRSIRAHFTPLENAYACVNQELLFRNNSTDTVASILNTYWNFGDGARDTLWSPRHRYESEGTYIVSLKIDNGCGWDTVSAPVIIYPLPKLEIKSEYELCETDTFTFVVKSDQELEYIKWNFGDGHFAGKDSVRYMYEGYGRFPVTVTGISAVGNRCTDSVTREVVVNNKPIMEIFPLDTMQCTPFMFRPSVDGTDYLMWDYGDGSGLTSAQEHWYENLSDTVQKFQVLVYAETDKGCKSEYNRRVTVLNRPRAAFDKKVEKGNPQKVTFINLSEEYSDCIWELPYLGTVHSMGDQVVKFGTQGTYPVRLIAVNYEGCRDTADAEHEVLIKGLYFPNTFIPHSLNGKVNHFIGIGMGLQRYKLEIFDTYGNKIWETRALEEGKPAEGWDGCNAKGEKMPQGMYTWRAEAIFADDEVWTGKNNESGVPETTQGTVLLLRE